MPALDEWDPKRGRSGREWERLKRKFFLPGSYCAICNTEISFDRRPRHPLGPSLDHITALIDGGHPTAEYNIQLVHLGCNVRKENARRRQVARPMSRPATKLRPLK